MVQEIHRRHVLSIIYSITDVKIPVDTGDFRLMDRKVVDVLKQMKERHRFPRGMSAWVGFKQIGVTYKRAARVAGVTKYPFRKMLKLALNAITGFSYFPLQVATYFGFVSAGVAILAIPCCHLYAHHGVRRFLRTSHDLDRSAFPRRRAIDFIGNSWRIYWTPVR